jgi:hypothetical protein
MGLVKRAANTTQSAAPAGWMAKQKKDWATRLEVSVEVDEQCVGQLTVF